MLSYASFVNFDVGFMVVYSCLLSPNFYDRLLFATIAPLVVITILSLAYYISKMCSRSRHNVINLQRRFLSVAVFVAFFVYSSVSSTIFQTFPCDYVDGDFSLMVDHSLSCTGSLHRKFQIYAGIMAVIYPVGVPAVFGWWLIRNRTYLKKSDRETTTHLQPFSGVWATYRPSRYYFEVVEYCRRLTLSMCSALLVPNSVDHIAVVLSLAVMFMFLSESLSPFERPEDMSLYRWGNGIIMASMYVALLMKAKEVDGEYSAFSVFGWLLITAHIVMVVIIVVEAVLLGRKWKFSMTTVKEVKTPVRRPTSVIFERKGSGNPPAMFEDSSTHRNDYD